MKNYQQNKEQNLTEQTHLWDEKLDNKLRNTISTENIEHCKTSTVFMKAFIQ